MMASLRPILSVSIIFLCRSIFNIVSPLCLTMVFLPPTLKKAAVHLAPTVFSGQNHCQSDKKGTPGTHPVPVNFSESLDS